MSAPTRGRALAALLLVTIIWGFGFLWMKDNLQAAERVLGRPGGTSVVAMYLAVRFALAAIVLMLWPTARRGLDVGAWKAGFIIGALLTSGFFLQMSGLQHVTPAVSAFLTSLYVVFAAIYTALLDRTKPKPALLAGVILATLGAGFIEGPPHLTFGVAEWMSVGCAAIFGWHIIATDRLTRAHNPAAVSITSFACTAVMGAAVVALASIRPNSPTTTELLKVLKDPQFLTATLLGSLLATVLALTLMNLYQRGLDPIRAAIVYALEPIWTTLIAWAYGMGTPTGWLVAGGSALVLGNLIAEWGAVSDQRAS
ncbi:MAG TPA: DMT family transporter [Candidatus Polarisedimenticolaceae bacterium]|nr:DMT family transporter [Candidatus Polarisedimenticolaceae bacterium]